MIPFDLSLYLVTDRSLAKGRPLEEVVEAAVKGGVTLVQLREKHCSSREFYQLAVSLKKVLSPYHIPLIINDRLDIVLASDAEGIHLGQQDLPVEIVRNILGKERLIGLSVENPEQAMAANTLDIDYIGISPVFGTPTKTDTAAPLGLEGVRQVTAISRHPAVAIGGIHPGNTGEILKAGACGVAVVSSIMGADDVSGKASEFRQLIQKDYDEKKI